jgi:hypothetical protein
MTGEILRMPQIGGQPPNNSGAFQHNGIAKLTCCNY